jgi:hypothetical protein
MEAIPILITGILTAAVANVVVILAPFAQASINAVLIG